MNGNKMEIEKKSVNRNNDINSLFNFDRFKNLIIEKKYQQIKDMLSNVNKDVILKDENGNTILTIAVYFENIDVFNICVEFNNMLLLQTTDNGKTPLIIACEILNFPFVKKILETITEHFSEEVRYNYINHFDNDGNTAYMTTFQIFIKKNKIINNNEKINTLHQRSDNQNMNIVNQQSFNSERESRKKILEILHNNGADFIHCESPTETSINFRRNLTEENENKTYDNSNLFQSLNMKLPRSDNRKRNHTNRMTKIINNIQEQSRVMNSNNNNNNHHFKPRIKK